MVEFAPISNTWTWKKWRTCVWCRSPYWSTLGKTASKRCCSTASTSPTTSFVTWQSWSGSRVSESRLPSRSLHKVWKPFPNWEIWLRSSWCGRKSCCRSSSSRPSPVQSSKGWPAWTFQNVDFLTTIVCRRLPAPAKCWR